jgi:uncharacterized membrane protein YphA (DoxX/SURF4 family)
MKVIGILLIVFGIVDFISSYKGFDLWRGFVGVNLPDFLWQISAYIEIGLGYFIVSLSKGKND